jgi:hypothetical protein
MEYVARKISRAKWELKPFMTGREIGADAATCCLRSSDNKLSFWKCCSDTSDIEEVLLAVASPMNEPDAVDIVWLESDMLIQDDFLLKCSDGVTPVKDLVHRHVDVIELTCNRICRLGEHIANEVRIGKNWRRFSRNRVKAVICEAIKSNRLSLGDLKEKMKLEIGSALEVS